MKNIILGLFIFLRSFLRVIQAVCMYFLWSKINPTFWWILLVVLILFYFGSKTYHTAVADGSDKSVIRFWHTARSIIFILDIAILIGMVIVLLK
jgi:hypothetical protein